jgi:hypothetical protein
MLRIIGYGAQSTAARNPSLMFLLYLVPILGGALALLELEGTLLPRFIARFRAAPDVPAT